MKKVVITLALMFTVAGAFSKTRMAHSKITKRVHILDTYKKIDAKELPLAVVEALLKEYPTSKLSQAFKNHQDQFKLIMVLKSGTTRTVFIDAYGRWFKG